LRFLPALSEVLDPASGALRIVFVTLDLKTFGGEEASLDRDTPGRSWALLSLCRRMVRVILCDPRV
jgi:hypothetical protein